MPAFTVEARGLIGLRRKMRTLFGGDSAHIISYLNERLGRYAVGALKGKPYPPERPKQKYRRTGTLNRAWNTVIENRAIHIKNAAQSPNGTYYAGFVVGPEISSIGNAQAWMHRGRWWNAPDVISETMPQVIEETAAYIESLWNG